MGEKITIELIKEEVELFKKFREYQEIWEEIFKVRSGKVILHFDYDKKLRKVEIKQIVWKC